MDLVPAVPQGCCCSFVIIRSLLHVKYKQIVAHASPLTRACKTELSTRECRKTFYCANFPHLQVAVLYFQDNARPSLFLGFPGLAYRPAKELFALNFGPYQ